LTFPIPFVHKLELVDNVNVAHARSQSKGWRIIQRHFRGSTGQTSVALIVTSLFVVMMIHISHGQFYDFVEALHEDQ
jgi:hypothetical protein